MVNLPVFFTPLLEDRASTIAVLVMAVADFFIPFFIAFMAFFAFMTFIAFTMTEVREKSKCEWPNDFPVS